MSSQSISNSQIVMNSVENQNTTDNTTSDPSAESKLSPVNNNSPKEPPSSDWGLFGDEDDLLKAIQTDDSTWAAVSGTQLTPNDNRIKQLLDSDDIIAADPSEINHSQVYNIDMDEELMLMSDHYSELPNSPEFSLDDLPIFSKQNTQLTLAENSPNVANVPMEIDSELAQSPLGNLDDLISNLDSALDEPPIDNITSEATDRHVTDQMDLLDLVDELPSTTQVPPVAASSSSAVSGPKPLPTASKETEGESHFKLSLRQRNAIQMHPFTIEQARFQHLIGKSNMKGKIRVSYTQVADSQDTEFSLSNTQLADVPEDEIMATQTSAENSRKSSSKTKGPSSKTKGRRKSVPSKVTKRPPHIRMRPDPDQMNLQDLSSPVFDKYGLDQLVIPPTTKAAEPTKAKIITFTKKKKSRKDRTPTQTRRFPPSSSTQVKQDIFDFDAQPRSTFNLTRGSSSTQSQSVIDLDLDDYVQRQLESMNDDPDLNDYGDYMGDEDFDDMELDDEETIKRRFRVKKHTALDSSDEEGYTDIEDFLEGEDPPSGEEEKELTEAEADAVFGFPGTSSASQSTGRRLVRPVRDTSVVPIVQDQLQYREHKRQRVGIHDVLKKKKTLRSVLPASFLKVYQKEILEEEKLRKAPKKRTTTATSTDITNNNTTRKHQSSSTPKTNTDVFAFLGSQSEESGEDSDTMQDAYPTLEEYATRLSHPITDVRQTYSSQSDEPTTSTRDITDFFQNTATQAPNSSSETSSYSGSMRRSHSNSKPSSNARQRPSAVNRTIYPADESIEDNRIQGHYQGPNVKKPTNRARRSTKRAPRSSIAIKHPPNQPKTTSGMVIRDNPAPKKRRKKFKRTRDDIYVHASNSYRCWNDRSGQAPDNSGRRFFQERANTPRMAFDDIYVGTRQSVRYANESMDADRCKDLFETEQNDHVEDKLSENVVQTLPSVVSRVRHMHDYDLRRISGLKDTVYLHQRLLAPLLSPIPNLKSAYKHLESNYTRLQIFDKNLTWRSITPANEPLLSHGFYKVSGDMFKVINGEIVLGDAELPGHDYFYNFVSICLTQWLPLQPYDERILLTEIFMRHVRYLTRCVPRLVEESESEDLPWRAIIKIMLYVLDWTCRLHHLGVHPIDWSVTECTKPLIDILVFIGFDDIKSGTKDYLAEAWICLLQIMSVSSKTSGFYFDEEAFLDQITDSIKTKSRSLGVYEFEKRRTTRLWAESLNFIIEKYMML